MVLPTKSLRGDAVEEEIRERSDGGVAARSDAKPGESPLGALSPELNAPMPQC